MNTKNKTKLLAILAVTAMALVPAFALIDSDDSSADTRDINVNDWGQFRTAMKDAREAPGVTFNITLTSPIYPDEGITIPSNVNMTVKGGTGISIINEVATLQIHDRKAVVNEGNITLKTGDMTVEAGTIYAFGKNASFVNRGTVVMEDLTRLMANEYATIVNYGTITADSVHFTIQHGGLMNDGTISLTGNGHLNIEKESEMTNSGTVEGDGYLLITKSKANNLGKITCKVRGGDVTQETSIVYDANKAGKTTWSEGFDTKVENEQIDNALKALGDMTVESLIQDAINRSIGKSGSATVSSADADLKLVSYYCDADYPNNMTLRTAMFDLSVTLKTKMSFTGPMPVEGTYEYGTVPPMTTKTINADSTVKISGLLRIDAYFDAGELLNRVNITFAVGIKTSTTADIELRADNDEYSVEYRNTKYDFGMNLELYAGIDFNKFDLMSYNPGDQWDVRGTIKIADIGGYIGLSANFYTANLLKYLYNGDPSETTQDLIDDLKYRGRTTIDLDELFDELFGSVALGAPVSPSTGAATVPTGASAAVPAVNGLLDNTFLFTASASMGEDGYITLTKGPASTGTIDLGEIVFTALEAEGQTSIEMDSEISGGSMASFVAGAVAIFTGTTQEQVEGVLADIGAEYAPSNITMKDVNRMCDQKLSYIDKMVGRDNSNNTVLYVVTGLISALAVIIAIPMFIRKK